MLDDLPELIKLSFARLCETEGNSGEKLKETAQTKPPEWGHSDEDEDGDGSGDENDEDEWTNGRVN